MSNDEIAQKIRSALSDLKDPETGRPLGANDQINKLEVTQDSIECSIRLSTHSWPIHDEYQETIKECIRVQAPDVADIQVSFTQLDRPPVPLGQIGLQAKSVIAVGSGKGGVGKSTLAATLAISLSEMGAKVGLMDADVYGPSIPHLLGLAGRPEIVNNKIRPIFAGQIPVMSMGFLVKQDEAVIWRGPMLHGSITQFLRDTYWGPLDYLIIDMPPGTGDVALTLSQLVPLTGAVVVCTPQEVALLDAVKAISMFRKTKIPILGMVENMSGFICPDCGKRYDIFGHGGARDKAEEIGVPFLGDIPMNIQLRQESDSGNLPHALSDPICSAALNKITRSMVRQINQNTAAAKTGPALPVL